ncbi:mitochondrial tRNA-specific 2-thiouridylase 1 isoform X2 [Onthophagus taurus]
MQNWDIADEKGVCSADQDYKDTSIVCEKLNIPLTHLNFVKEYWNEVFLNLIKEYETGSTPNPDILCNKNLKFNYFYNHAIENLEADAIATGHYAANSFGAYLENYDPNQNAKLLLPRDKIKDQTFFLSQINQNALRKTMFPLSELTKPEVKALAVQNGLEIVAKKKESMGICFIGNRNFQDFISEYIEDKEGNFIDIDTGEIVGKHNGIHHWTLGQRSRIAGIPKGYFIAQKNVENNSIYVALGSEHPSLYTQTFCTSKPHWICDQPKDLETSNVFNCQFRFQHTHETTDCNLFETDQGLIGRLSKPVKAITEGQYAVFYKNNECLGSGKIVFRGVPNSIRFWLDHNKSIKVYDLFRKCKSKDEFVKKVNDVLNKNSKNNKYHLR